MRHFTVREVIPWVRDYYELPGNAAGGSLHIVLEDGNVDEPLVAHCIQYAAKRGDKAGVALGNILLRMSPTQRAKVADLHRR